MSPFIGHCDAVVRAILLLLSLHLHLYSVYAGSKMSCQSYAATHDRLSLHFTFNIVNCSFLDDDVPLSTSYGVYIFQLIRFARASSHVADFNTNKVFRLINRKVYNIMFTSLLAPTTTCNIKSFFVWQTTLVTIT